MEENNLVYNHVSLSGNLEIGIYKKYLEYST